MEQTEELENTLIGFFEKKRKVIKRSLESNSFAKFMERMCFPLHDQKSSLFQLWVLSVSAQTGFQKLEL